MKPEVSLPHSKMPARQINPVRASSSNFLTVHFNIILLLTSRSSKWFHTLRFPHKTLLHLSCPYTPKLFSFLLWSAEQYFSQQQAPSIPSNPNMRLNSRTATCFSLNRLPIQASNTTFKKHKVKVIQINSPFAVFFFFLLCGIPQIHSSGHSVADSSETFFYVVIRYMLVVLKYLQSSIKLCKFGFQTSSKYFEQIWWLFVVHVKPKNIETGSMMVLVMSYIFYLPLYLLNRPIV
jgi:hypothetical protein